MELKQNLAKRAEAGNVKLNKSMNIADMIKVLEPEIRKALPSVITPERFTRMALSAINNTPKLAECTPISFLAALMNVDAENLKATIAEYNEYCIGGSKEGQADQFGRTLFGPAIDTAPFYAGARVPTVHHTMGGVRIDTLARVYHENGEIIENLYAAGEVTGGIHGTNRLGGNALTDTVVFGRIAGESAALQK